MKKLSFRKKMLLLWICIHYVILLFSYSTLDFFNHFGEYKFKEFWPLVKYADYDKQFLPTRILANGLQDGLNSNETKIINSYGIFSNYDISEFLVYCIFGILIYILVTPPKRQINRTYL